MISFKAFWKPFVCFFFWDGCQQAGGEWLRTMQP